MVVKLLGETMVEYYGIILDVYTMCSKRTEGLEHAIPGSSVRLSYIYPKVLL